MIFCGLIMWYLSLNFHVIHGNWVTFPCYFMWLQQPFDGAWMPFMSLEVPVEANVEWVYDI